MKKILFICESTSGGVRRHLVDLITEIEKREIFEVHLIYNSTRSDVQFRKFIEEFNSKIYLYDIKEMSKKNLLKNLFKTMFIINKEIKKINPEIIHCHSSVAGFYGRLCKLFNWKVNFFYTPHAYYGQALQNNKSKRNIYNFIEKLLSKLTYHTILVSKGEQNYGVNNKITSLEKSSCIYNGIKKTDRIFISREDNNRIFKVGFLGRLDTQKNPSLFIKIAEEVLKIDGDFTFVLIGNGELYNIIQEEIENSKFSSKFSLLGHSDNPEAILEQLDVLVSTSLYEGLPYSLIESLEKGLPIVATNVIGNNEIVDHDVNGYLFNENELDKASNSIINLKNDKKDYENKERESIEKFNEKFTLNEMVDKTLNLYLRSYR